MTSDDKVYKQFWITDPSAYTEHFIHENKNDAEQSGDFIIHTIEYAALLACETKLAESEARLAAGGTNGK